MHAPSVHVCWLQKSYIVVPYQAAVWFVLHTSIFMLQVFACLSGKMHFTLLCAPEVLQHIPPKTLQTLPKPSRYQEAVLTKSPP
jgi:hypothetical protein